MKVFALECFAVYSIQSQLLEHVQYVCINTVTLCTTPFGILYKLRLSAFHLPTAGWEDVNVRFLCGADLLESFSVPGLWAEKDVSVTIGAY